MKICLSCKLPFDEWWVLKKFQEYELNITNPQYFEQDICSPCMEKIPPDRVAWWDTMGHYGT